MNVGRVLDVPQGLEVSFCGERNHPRMTRAVQDTEAPHWSGARVLVTGATGCTGRALCRALREREAHVVGWATRECDEDLTSIGVQYECVDICQAEQVHLAMEKVDIVFHLAAAYRKESFDHSHFKSVNVEGTRHLLDAAEAVGVIRFVHVSTVGVQGEIQQPPAAEDYRTAPGDHYQVSKLEGELEALRRFHLGLPVTVVRPVGIYGPGDTRFLKLFRPIHRGRFVMIGDGEPLYHLTYIEDLVAGLLLAATSPRAVGEVFTIAGSEYTSLGELVERVAATLEVPPPRWRIPYTPVFWAAKVCEFLGRLFRFQPPLYPRRVEFFKLDRAFSIDKARAVLGYRPAVTLEEGLRRTAEWYAQEGLL